MLAAAPAADLHAQDRTRFEEGIIEVVAERLPPLTLVVLVDSAGGMLLPVRAIASHVGLEATSSGTILSFPRLDGARTTLDTAARTIAFRGDILALPPAEIVVDGDDVFLRAERLALVLEADVTLDPATLTIVLGRDVPFPAQQRIIAEQRRAVLLAGQDRRADRARMDAVPFARTTLPGVLDWEVASSGLDPGRLTTIRAQAGAAVLGGDLLAAGIIDVGREATETARDLALRYHRVFGWPALRQLRAGDIISTGLFGRWVNGVEITNRPYLRHEELGEVLVRPDLPPGWEYEVLQGSRLLGFSDAAARDPVAVPLRAGGIPVQIRMYGPAGEEVVSTLLYQAPVSLLGRHVLEYTAGAGTCDGTTCDRFAHGDVRFGATSRLTVGGGAEYIADTVATHLRPYAIAAFTTGMRATGELQLMPGALYAASMMLYPQASSVAMLRTSLSRPGFGPISLIPDSRSRWDIEASWEERLRGRGNLRSVRVGGAAGGTAATGTQRWRASLIAGLARGYAELRYDNDRIATDPHLVSARTGLLLPFRLGARTLRPLITAGAGVDGGGVRIAELGATFQAGPASVLGTALTWSRGLSRPGLQFTFSARPGPVQTAVRAVSSPRGGGTSSASVSGSFALSPDGRLSLFPHARTGYGAFYGTVFIDHDGDGVLSDGDERVAGAHVHAGDLRITADDNGRFRAWGLVPFTPVTVAIDSARIADPGWISPGPPPLLRAAPNAARRVDIALVQTRELLGAVTADSGVATVAGISILVTHAESGASITTTTFVDGLFYVSRLRPGAYRATISVASLDAIRADADPTAIEFVLPAAGDDPLFELPPFRLRPRPPGS